MNQRIKAIKVKKTKMILVCHVSNYRSSRWQMFFEVVVPKAVANVVLLKTPPSAASLVLKKFANE